MQEYWANLTPEEYAAHGTNLTNSALNRWASESAEGKVAHGISSQEGITPEGRQRMSENTSRRNREWHRDGTHPEFSAGSKRGAAAMKEFWKTPGNEDEKAAIVRRIIESRGGMVPSKSEPEKTLEAYLGIVAPGEFRYNDGWFILGRKVPDFVNVNGQKKLIELYGTHWHDIGDDDERIEYFRGFGYKTLVIWDDELYDPRIFSRLSSFIYPWNKRWLKAIRRWVS